jgi:hypothetical protein
MGAAAVPAPLDRPRPSRSSRARASADSPPLVQDLADGAWRAGPGHRVDHAVDDRPDPVGKHVWREQVSFGGRVHTRTEQHNDLAYSPFHRSLVGAG